MRFADIAPALDGEEELQELVSPLGCHGSLFLGFVGGLTMFVLALCVFRRDAQQRHSRWMLSAPDTAVKRASASVKKSWFLTTGGERSQPTYMVRVEFDAVRKDSTWATVVADVVVLQESFNRASQGTVEVAYAIGDEQAFEVVGDLETWRDSKYCNTAMARFVVACFGLVGLASGVASGPLTQCYYGYAPFFGLLVVGSVCGHVFCWPLARRCRRARHSVEVKPCRRHETPAAASA